MPSHIQVKKSYVNENPEDQELLTLDVISPIWARRLEESKLLPILSRERLRLYLELRDTSKCVVGEAHGFSSSYVYNCKGCSKIAWKFMFYFMIHSYSKLETTKNEFVAHWGEKHHTLSADDRKKDFDWNEVIKKEASGIDDGDFVEVQLTIGDTVITEKGVTDKNRFTCQETL